MESWNVTWKGEDGLQWRAQLGIHQQAPCIYSLEYEKNAEWTPLCQMLTPQFKVVTGKRTTHNPQREKPLEPGEAPDYQWDTYSDDPFSKPDVTEATEQWSTTSMKVEQQGRHTVVTFDGLTL